MLKRPLKALFRWPTVVEVDYLSEPFHAVVQHWCLSAAAADELRMEYSMKILLLRARDDYSRAGISIFVMQMLSSHMINTIALSAFYNTRIR